MCGFCAENIYIIGLYQKINGEDTDYCTVEGPLYLQEQEATGLIFEKIRHDWDVKYLYPIIHCCNMYNRLFSKKNDYYQDISPEIEDFKGISNYEFIFDEPQNAINTTPLSYKAVWIDLYRPETVDNDRLWLNFTANSKLIDASKEALGYYIEWWLTEEFAPINEIWFGEDDNLFRLLPVFYFSLTFLAFHKCGDDLLEHIAVKNSGRTPSFTGYDLWLQRTALHLIIKNKGINLIKRFWQKVRFEMVYIELIKSYRRGENGEKLISVIRDYYSFLSDKGRYLIQDYGEEDENNPLNMLINLESKIL